jgi:hypothetical protein
MVLQPNLEKKASHLRSVRRSTPAASSSATRAAFGNQVRTPLERETFPLRCDGRFEGCDADIGAVIVGAAYGTYRPSHSHETSTYFVAVRCVAFLKGTIGVRYRKEKVNMLDRALIVTIGMYLIASSFAQGQEVGHMLVTSTDIKWTGAPPSMQPGAQFALIEGDLKKAEPFMFRLKLPANYKIPPHTHPAIEHVTVLSGAFHMGPGDQHDPKKAVTLTPGSFAVFQPGHSMFAWTEEETVIQVHGVGPWGINYINPADDPRNE